MSSLGRPAAAVRMMTPPVKPCVSAELADDAAQARALLARLDLRATRRCDPPSA